MKKKRTASGMIGAILLLIFAMILAWLAISDWGQAAYYGYSGFSERIHYVFGGGFPFLLFLIYLIGSILTCGGLFLEKRKMVFTGLAGLVIGSMYFTLLQILKYWNSANYSKTYFLFIFFFWLSFLLLFLFSTAYKKEVRTSKDRIWKKIRLLPAILELPQFVYSIYVAEMTSLLFIVDILLFLVFLLLGIALTADAVPKTSSVNEPAPFHEPPADSAWKSTPANEQQHSAFTASTCPNCGAKLEPDDVFCPTCGTRIK